MNVMERSPIRCAECTRGLFRPLSPPTLLLEIGTLLTRKLYEWQFIRSIVSEGEMMGTGIGTASQPQVTPPGIEPGSRV